MRALYIRDVSFDDMDRGTFASRLYDDIGKKLWEVCGELNESGVNGTCLIFVQRTLKVWPGTVKYFNEGIREQIAKILQNVQGTIEKGTAIWVQINEIIQLLLPPQFATVCNDILDLWIESSNRNEALLHKVSKCGDAWRVAVRRGASGRLEVQVAKKIEGEEEEEEEEGDGPETAHGAHHGGAHAPDAALWGRGVCVETMPQKEDISTLL